MSAEVVTVPKPLSYTAMQARYASLLDAVGLAEDEALGLSPEQFDEAVSAKLAEKQSGARTETKDLLAEPITVELAGRQYDVKPLMWGKDIEWRRKCGRLVGHILRMNGGGDAELDLQSIVPLLFSEFADDLVEMMFLYSPELTADRDRIIAETNPGRLIEAADQVLQMALPTVLPIVNITIKAMVQFRGAGLTMGS